MSSPIPLRCRCGRVQGQMLLAPGPKMRWVCYCDDCQAYAHALGRADILDAHGGTEVVPTTPARLTFTSGFEQVRCLRLSDKGMMRWHTGCCSTPVANTLAKPGVAFVSIHRPFMDLSDASVLGPVRRVQARFALGVPPADAEQKASLKSILSTVRFLLAGRLRGEHKPNPLLVQGKPVVTPRVLSAEEREQLRSRS